MDLTNFTIGNALMVAVSGFLVVFLMLVILWMLIVITSKIVQKVTVKETPKTAPVVQPTQVETEEKENDDDLVLIPAAIAAYLSTSTDQLVVRSIRKVNDNQSAWKTAARVQNHIL